MARLKFQKSQSVTCHVPTPLVIMIGRHLFRQRNRGFGVFFHGLPQVFHGGVNHPKETAATGGRNSNYRNETLDSCQVHYTTSFTVRLLGQLPSELDTFPIFIILKFKVNIMYNL